MVLKINLSCGRSSALKLFTKAVQTLDKAKLDTNEIHSRGLDIR